MKRLPCFCLATSPDYLIGSESKWFPVGRTVITSPDRLFDPNNYELRLKVRLRFYPQVAFDVIRRSDRRFSA